MPTQSIIAACQLKFAALTAGNFPGGVLPTLYFDTVPQTDGHGAQIDVTTQGLCVLKDNGQTPDLMSFQLQTREVEQFEIGVFYLSLGDVDQAVLAIKRNGGTTAQKLGFDFGLLPDLVSPRGTFVIRRVKEQRSREAFGRTNALVHACRLSYRVEVLESA